MTHRIPDCEWCGCTYWTKSATSKYCSASCKQRAYEYRVKQRRDAEKVTLTMYDQTVMQSVNDVDQLFHELLSAEFIKGEVDYLKALFVVLRNGPTNVILWEYGFFDKLEEIYRAWLDRCAADIPF